jgi:hypothetical protein
MLDEPRISSEIRQIVLSELQIKMPLELTEQRMAMVVLLSAKQREMRQLGLR